MKSKLIFSLLLFSGLFGGIFFAEKATAAPYWCDIRLLRDDVCGFLTREQCEASTSTPDCQQAVGSNVPERVWCAGADTTECYASLEFCAENGGGVQFCHERQYDTATGTVGDLTGSSGSTTTDTRGGKWCWTNVISTRTRCADTAAECTDYAGVGTDCVFRDDIDTLYCFDEGGESYCFTEEEDCQDYGLDLGLFTNSCRAVSTATGATTPGSTLPPPSLKYRPLEKEFISQENAYLPNFLRYIFNVGIAIVGMSALVMLTIGGFTYITSAGNNANAETAKKIIRDAFIGVIMAFFSWLLLYVINPDLVDIDANLAGLSATSPDMERARQAGRGAPYTGSAYQPSNELRVATQLKNAGISIVSSGAPRNPGEEYRRCTGPTDTGCTSVGDLPQKSVDALVNLKQACSGCNIVVTGGSEEGSHRSHRPGANIFDLRLDDNLQNYIVNNGQENPPISRFGETINARNWRITSGPLAGALVVKERNHFHIDMDR